jgi:hypothetical protein
MPSARGDMPAVLGAMDPGIEWHEAEGNPCDPGDQVWRGPDAVMQNLFVRLATEWDGFTARPREFHDAGPAVVAGGRYTGPARRQAGNSALRSAACGKYATARSRASGSTWIPRRCRT